MIELTVNGETVAVEVEPDMPLLWLLRDVLNLTGTKFGCGIAACGACTVHVNGQAMRSCVLPVSAVVGSEITTIEALAEHEIHPVQHAWIEEQVPQCGYCQSGMIMAVAALLEQKPKVDDAELVSTITNICRCGSYESIKRAVRSIKAKLESQYA